MVGLKLTRRRSIQDLERLVRARFQREGGVMLLATPGDERQELQLRRLYKRLQGDQGLQVGLFDGGGYRYLTVTRPGEQISVWTDWLTD
jgi:hypothetical protein